MCKPRAAWSFPATLLTMVSRRRACGGRQPPTESAPYSHNPASRYELANFTRVYGLNGSDGLLSYPLYEGRGNHDGGNSTDTMPHPVASLIVARNQARLAQPSTFSLTNVSATGLHYSWRWPLSQALPASCAAHFFMLNEYSGHLCDG